jgi:hypothetical protein
VCNTNIHFSQGFEVLRAATEDYCLKVPKFQRNVLLSPSWLKIKLSLEGNDLDKKGKAVSVTGHGGP